MKRRLLASAGALWACLFAGLLLLAGAAPAQTLHLPPPTRTTLENGIRVVLMEYHRAPTLVVSAIFPGGVSVETAQKAGAASISSPTSSATRPSPPKSWSASASCE